ncbi:hypothetical protein LOTGIDRAFT_234696 [Lottia gigantea]|uniref:Centrosome and spindle pole-associated protein 1 C-terminal domain-containing protein n=1 Tax=Lottia gigantea TaxID=225164 RepID=V3ZZM8_LOTGI|nr:hypothetical protein LOTGIDRAFT_234696 [Lottia gigantea]ESO88125.1 hypothetical protein LOTGIDRAFT_234696 [Lottia gigantea]
MYNSFPLNLILIFTEFSQKGDKNRKEWREISKEDLLIKDSNDRKKKLAEERKNEYKQLLESKPNKNREWNNSEGQKPLLSDREDKKKALQKQRQQEYNDLKKNNQNTRNNDQPRPGTPGGFLNKLGSHEKQRQKLKDERHEEYKRLQAEKMWLNHDFADPRMLHAKDCEIYATLPGMNYYGSATRREKAVQRNKEYNKIKPFIDSPRSLRGENEPPGAPRKGWGTPTYEEMLEKKRNEEQKYRRLNDPDYTRPGMKSYNSESALHRLEDEKRLKDILQTETKKSNILSNGILDDPDWLRQNRPDPDRAYSQLNELPPRGRGVYTPAVHEYPPRGIRDAPTYLPESNKHRFYATLPVGQEDRDELQKRKEEYKHELMRQMKEAEEARKKNKQEFIEPSPEKQQQPTPPQKVIIIPNKQLPDVVPPQQQIQQQQQQQYQLTSGIDRLSPRSEMLLGRTRDLERLERRLKKIEQQNAAINPLDIAELDFISKRDPRTQMFPSGPADHMGTGILEQGFDRLLEPPKVGSVKVPVGLEYTPSTYVTGGDHFDKFSSVDKAYHYYGSHNPLDTGLPAAPTQIAATNYGSVPTGNQIVMDNYRAAPGGGGLGGGGYSSPVLGGPSAAAIQESINQGSDAERKAKQRAQAQQYQRELERQMEEKKLKQAIAKEEKERYEQKLEDDIRNYNPFGRGGAGAPMKDEYGNVVADLRAKNKGYSPRYEPMSSPTRGGPRPASPKDDLIKTPPAQTTAEGESTYARGGHGIFGHPKTEAEKSQADRYKEELKRQIDNKKREAELEKERERREEERQQKIIDDQRRKMQEEYDEEKRRIQAKQDEQDRKNAEIIKLQEDQKVKESELRGEKKKREEGRLEYERQRQEREEKERGKSPPIHALRKPKTENNDSENKENDVENKTTDNKQEDDRKTYDYRTYSPLIPTLRHRNLDVYTDNVPPARNNSADVLNQLAHMRRQLQSERKRVENMLEETRNEPDVFDPRLVQQTSQQQIPVQVQSRNDIFETALNRNAVQVRRGGTADMKILQEFDDLKYKEDTDSRKQFRKLYPVDPRTQDDLESQQAALLRQQEERLRRYTDSPIDLPGTSASPQSMLHSNSAFIDVEGMDRSLFPDDFDDFPKRNESARDRRRQREANRYPSKSPRDISTDLPSNYNPMGSVVSLDVDRIQRKNDNRLKRLKEIQGDDVSLYDPDDVINRFMEKQSHNRPPSNNTLHDDSWLLPGNKNKRY